MWVEMSIVGNEQGLIEYSFWVSKPHTSAWHSTPDAFFQLGRNIFQLHLASYMVLEIFLRSFPLVLSYNHMTNDPLNVVILGTFREAVASTVTPDDLA